MKINHILPIMFLGVAENISERGHSPFPFGNTDLMGLSSIKNFVVYPTSSDSLSFIFFIHRSIASEVCAGEIKLFIDQPDGNNFMSCSINATLNDQLGFNISNFGYFQLQDWTPIIIDKFNTLIPFPGIYSIHYLIGDEKIRIADVCFHYQISPSLSAEELYGLKARMLSCRSIIVELKCTECNYSTKAYTSIARDVSLEHDGCIWQTELPDKFYCKCGKIEHTLKYYKESLHGLLRVLSVGKGSNAGKGKYERLYSHNIIRSIVNDF